MLSSGFFNVGPECVYPTIAAVAAKWTNRSHPTSKLLYNALAFRAMNLGAAADRTPVRTDYVNQFHKQTRPGHLQGSNISDRKRLRSVGYPTLTRIPISIRGPCFSLSRRGRGTSTIVSTRSRLIIPLSGKEPGEIRRIRSEGPRLHPSSPVTWTNSMVPPLT